MRRGHVDPGTLLLDGEGAIWKVLSVEPCADVDAFDLQVEPYVPKQ